MLNDKESRLHVHVQSEAYLQKNLIYRYTNLLPYHSAFITWERSGAGDIRLLENASDHVSNRKMENFIKSTETKSEKHELFCLY